jgi:uncharacterized protein YjiK/2',3'-cyclic-nucleotide 2'-phosphodiesterase (5'-nucleotidase family)/phosphodiesterase/alkaline phosphatase D-like protein
MAINDIDLSKYTRIGRYDLPEPKRTTAPTGNLLAQEVSAVTYNKDTDTLFVLGDGGTSIVQVSKTGVLIDSMTLASGTSPQGTAFYDPEGLAYVGGGKFAFVEERDRQVNLFTYTPNTTLARTGVQTVKLGTTIGNIGIEGISYDPQTSGFIAVKEITPEGIFQTTIDFAAGTASNGSPTALNSTDLFDPTKAGLGDFADVYALSNVAALNGKADAGNLLLLSQADGKIVEVDRAGNILSTLTIVSDAGNPLSIPDQQHEGLTVDQDGNLYVVSENGGGDIDHPQLWVYAPSVAVNAAPTALTLNNKLTSIVENTSIATPLKVADIAVTDDALGTNTLSLTGADAGLFEITGNVLSIKAGTKIDFETKTSYSVNVNVDDSTVGSTPDVTTAYTLAVTDVANETPPTSTGGIFVTEVAPWSSGNSPVAADWFELTNTGSAAVNITGWKFDDNSNTFANALTLNGITSIGAGESVVFIETTAATTPTAPAAFLTNWFGTKPPTGLQIGTYTGAGAGLSTAGDAVNIYNAAGVLQTNLVFGASPASAPFATFNNAALQNNATTSTLSAIGTNGASSVTNLLPTSISVTEIGSPGRIAEAPAYTLQLLNYYGESGLLGVETAPILGALIDKFDDQYSNTLVLGEGDSYIPGPWLIGGSDPSLNSVAGIGTTAIGRPDIAIMNAFGTNASALGNHEFDLGSPVLQAAIAASGTGATAWAGAQFPFITTNLNFAADSSLRGIADATLGGTATNDFAGKEASVLKGKIAPYTVVTKGGEKIGIVGATTYDLLSKTSPNGTVPKDDGIPTTDDLQEVAAYIQTAVDALKAAGVNKIVLVDQLDTIERNKALAPLVTGIDVMVAGGGHERLGDATDKAVGFNGHTADFVGTYPIVTAGKDGKATLIVTTDTEYSYLGRLVVDFNADGEIIVPNLNPIINGAYASNQATLQTAYGSTETAKQIVASSAIGTKVSAITDAINNVIISKDSNIYGYTKVYLEGDRAFGRAQEVNLGDISADANLFKAKAAIAPGTILASLKNGGGIRASVGSIGETGEKLPPAASNVKPAGAISQLDAENALRFDNKLIVFDTTPQGLLNILNYAAGLAPGNGGYAQIGGVRFSYDPTKAAGQRVQDIAIYDLDDKLVARVADNGVLLADAPAKISVVTLNFTANGGDGYPIKENADNFRYLLNNGTLSAPVDKTLDLTAVANVPANTLGELKAFEDFLKANYGTPQKAYNVADTPATQDQRIQNLQVKTVDTVIPANTAPTNLTLSNPVTTLAENTSTATRIKVADISFTDDIQGTNSLTVTGADASSFEIVNNALYIKAGTTLDFESKKSYGVAVNVDDATVGITPDASKTFTLSLTDVTIGSFSGVAAGDATTNDAILWTRTYNPNTNKGINSNLTAQVSTDANFGSIAFSYKNIARTDALDHDGTAKINATGLASGTKYYYRFLDAAGEFSQVGTFKTALAADVKAPVRFGFSGDYDGVMRPYSSTANFGKLNLDFFGNVGDTIYETASTGSPAAADAAKDPAQALIDYHRKYLENLQPVKPDGFPSLQTFFASQGNYTSLDNHELGNKQLINGGAPSILATDAGNGTNNTTYDVNKTGTFINQTVGFKTLEQAYTDYQPIKEKLVVAPDDARSNGTQQLYNSQQWGKNVLYVNTDTRSYRDVRLKTTDAAGKITTTDDTGVRADNPDRTLLGKTQLAWLKQNLLDAQKNGTAWKFVAITDPIDQLGAIGSGADGGKSWIGGYRAERNELLKFIADNGIKNVVFLSCDDHQNRINELTYLDNINDPTSIRVLPGALSIVDGPIGATGPDGITDHSFANIKALADKLAAKQTTEKVNPIGLDPNFAGLKNVYREGDPNADTNRQAADFYSPDTFNYTTFDVSADGKTLNVAVQGINSYASNTFQEPSATNPVRTILSFSLDADVPPTQVSGSTGADNLIAGVTPGFSPSNNNVFTGAGKDTVDIAIAGNLASNNRVDLGSGDDVIYIANADRIFGSTGDDTLDATDAKDYRASGGAGNDTFYLGSNGRALGGDGNDKFFASIGGGNLISGGAGVDQFWIANGDIPTAANTILDFQIGTDVIGIQGIDANATNVVLAQVGADTSISFGGQTLAVLKGTQANALTPSNPGQFVFA